MKRQNGNSAKIKQLQNSNLTYELYQFVTNNPDGVDYNNITMVFVVMVGVLFSLAAVWMYWLCIQQIKIPFIGY